MIAFKKQEHLLTVQTLMFDVEKLDSLAGEIRGSVSATEAKRVRDRLIALQMRRSEDENRLDFLVHLLEEYTNLPHVFETRYDHFLKWAASMKERLLHKRRILLDDAIQRLSGPLRQELDAKEKESAWLIAKGQELSTACSQREQEVLGKIENVERVWDQLQKTWRQELERLQQLPTDMEGLNSNLAVLTAWFSQVEAALNAPLIVATCDQEAVEAKLNEHQQLENSIETRSGSVSSLMNLCESFTSNYALRDGWLGTDLNGIQSAMDSLERRWGAICQEAARRQTQLLSLWPEWNAIISLSAQLDQLMSNLDASVPENTSTTSSTQVEEFSSQLEAIIHQVHAPSTHQLLDHLNSKYCNLAREGRIDAAGQLQQLVSGTNGRWRALSDRLSSLLQTSRDTLSSINHWRVSRVKIKYFSWNVFIYTYEFLYIRHA